MISLSLISGLCLAISLELCKKKQASRTRTRQKQGKVVTGKILQLWFNFYKPEILLSVMVIFAIVQMEFMLMNQSMLEKALGVKILEKMVGVTSAHFSFRISEQAATLAAK